MTSFIVWLIETVVGLARSFEKAMQELRLLINEAGEAIADDEENQR